MTTSPKKSVSRSVRSSTRAVHRKTPRSQAGVSAAERAFYAALDADPVAVLIVTRDAAGALNIVSTDEDREDVLRMVVFAWMDILVRSSLPTHTH